MAKEKSFKEVKEFYEKEVEKLEDVNTKSGTGIYVIYLENIKCDNYVPLYIGQSVNIYGRKKQHKNEIKKLFIKDNETYNNEIRKSSGKYLYTKIVSTLKNNNLTMDNIKFKVLENCEKEELDEKENYYIETFNLSIYGFNQFDEIIKTNKKIGELMHKGMNKDILIDLLKLQEDIFKKIIDIYDSNINYKYYKFNINMLLGSGCNIQQIITPLKLAKGNDIEERLEIIKKLQLIFEQDGMNDEVLDVIKINV